MWSLRTFAGFLLGLLLCLGIWVAVPYNNFALNNSFVSDGYLPEIVIFCIVILVVIVNPLLRRIAPRFVLSHRQLALIGSMMLFAAVIPSNGLMRFFPHCLAYETQKINQSKDLSEAIQDSALPPSLFPDEIGFDKPTPVSDQLIDELEPGQTIPWSAWLRPLFAWGTVFAAMWLMMIGLGAMVYPQWRYNERLSFPLLSVYHSLIDEPENGESYPRSLRSKLFWVGFGLVLVLHSFNGLALFTKGAFPTFPISWDISSVFTEGVWRNAPGFLKGSRIYFLFVGLAYFMPNRHSFSIWFTVLFFGLLVMCCRTYMPSFNDGYLYDHGCGALVAIALGILWLGRVHYVKVLRAAIRGGATDEERTDALAGRMFLLGCVAIVGWFVWAGTGIGWSLFFMTLSVMIMLLVARIVAETGITYIWIIPLTASRFIGLLPQKWLSVSTIFMQQALYIMANRASAVSAAAIMMLSLGLSKKAEPKSARRLAWTGLAVLMLGLLVCGAVHLDMGYNLSTSYDGLQSPITGRGARQMGMGPISDFLMGRENTFAAGQIQFMLLGFAIAGILLFLCARFPSWPLHPIGLIFVHSSIGLRLVISLFLGWMIKQIVLRYGGAKVYRMGLPLFLGFILGEIFANAFWTLIPALQIMFGADPTTIPHMVIFQYT